MIFFNINIYLLSHNFNELKELPTRLCMADHTFITKHLIGNILVVVMPRTQEQIS